MVNPDYYQQTVKNRPSETTPERGRPLSERDLETRDRWEEHEKDRKKTERE